MKVAVVGLGKAGQTIHLPAISAIPGLEIVAACDTDAMRRAEASKKFGFLSFADFDEMLRNDQPDVVVIGTPPDSHADYCLRAFAAGAHVICEKPFTSSLLEADEVFGGGGKAHRRIALNHEFREMAIFRALREQVGKPGVGQLTFVQIWQLMDLPPWREPGWRGRMLQRTLYEAGVHLVDYAMALFGEKPVAVSATTSSCGESEGKSDAVALATLEFSRGRIAHIIQNRLCRGETQYFEVRAEGTESSLRASFGGRARVTAGLHRSTKPHVRIDYGISGIAWREVETQRTFLARNPKDPVVRATRDVIEKTLLAFQNGTEPPASGETGRDVLEVIAACYHSAETGRRVEMNDGELAGLRDLRMGGPPAG